MAGKKNKAEGKRNEPPDIKFCPTFETAGRREGGRECGREGGRENGRYGWKACWRLGGS